MTPKFDYKTHEAGTKPCTPRGATWYGVVWDKTGARRKQVWSCQHRHRDQTLARNCAGSRLTFEVGKARVEEWEQAFVDIIPPEHFYERAGQPDEKRRTTLCKVCWHLPSNERHLPKLRTDIAIRAGQMDQFARWIGPKMGFVSGKGGIYFSGGFVCKAWMDLVFKLGFVKDLAGMEPGDAYPKWRQPLKGDSVDFDGNIIATQLNPGVLVNSDGTRTRAWVVR